MRVLLVEILWYIMIIGSFKFIIVFSSCNDVRILWTGVLSSWERVQRALDLYLFWIFSLE